tara:strand:- start:157 stop:801 length:645 start_codon:yes stop_codon:yes gene_type:complete
MADMEFEGHFESVIMDLNDQVETFYNLVNQGTEMVSPQYLNLLNCNSVTSVFRTINTTIPVDEKGLLALNTLITPTLTIEFSEPGPPLILNFNIWPEFTNETDDAKIQIIAKSSLFWGYSISKTIQPEEAEFWQPVQYAQERAAVQLENDLMEAMRKGRQGTQAVHDFIPKVGIFLSAPQNIESALVTPGGEVPEGPGGEDFPGEPIFPEEPFG